MIWRRPPRSFTAGCPDCAAPTKPAVVVTINRRHPTRFYCCPCCGCRWATSWSRPAGATCMIAAACPPERCRHCRTTRPGCVDKREFSHKPPLTGR